jgi:hypothetical protein
MLVSPPRPNLCHALRNFHPVEESSMAVRNVTRALSLWT